MKYGTFLSMVRPYYITRGVSLVGGEGTVYNFIHLALQEAWNYRDWSFKKPTEIIEPIEIDLGNNKKKYKYPTQFPFQKTASVVDELHQFLSYGDDFYYEEENNITYVVTNKCYSKLKIQYFKKYLWIPLDIDSTIEIPFPDSFIPALLQKAIDVGSPLLSFEGERTPTYIKAQKALDDLYDIDGYQDGGSIKHNTY